MTIRKSIQGALYLVECLLLYISTQVPHFYANHLNFMRSVLYRSHQIEAHYLPLIQGLPLVFLVLAGISLWRGRNVHRYLFGIGAVGYALMTWLVSRPMLASYYVILGLLLVVVILQLIQVALDGGKRTAHQS